MSSYCCEHSLPPQCPLSSHPVPSLLSPSTSQHGNGRKTTKHPLRVASRDRTQPSTPVLRGFQTYRYYEQESPFITSRPALALSWPSYQLKILGQPTSDGHPASILKCAGNRHRAIIHRASTSTGTHLSRAPPDRALALLHANAMRHIHNHSATASAGMLGSHPQITNPVFTKTSALIHHHGNGSYG